MKELKRGKLKRRPSAPGEILKDIFLDANGITQASFAKDLSILTKGRVKESIMKTKLSEVIKGKRAMSVEFAILVSELLGTSPKMWLNLQSSLDLWIAQKHLDLAS